MSFLEENKYKYNFAFFLKTYKNDLKRVNFLLNSFYKFNKENIAIFVSVPKEDYVLFKDNLIYNNTQKLFLMNDEEITPDLIKEKINSFSVGYINQQIIKLSFWKTKLAKYYLCIDSDVMFIKDFFVSDFMYDENTPFQVLTEDKELSLDLSYRHYYFDRKKCINNIFRKIHGSKNYKLLSCHGLTILSSDSLRTFFNNFLTKTNLTISNLLEKETYEFSWYNAWLQKNIINYKHCEPFIKTFHTKNQYIDSILENNLDDIRQEYLGICINSNWANKLQIFKYGEIPKKYNFLFFIEKFLLKTKILLRKKYLR